MVAEDLPYSQSVPNDNNQIRDGEISSREIQVLVLVGI